jgi:hypothetical protein
MRKASLRRSQQLVHCCYVRTVKLEGSESYAYQRDTDKHGDKCAANCRKKRFNKVCGIIIPAEKKKTKSPRTIQAKSNQFHLIIEKVPCRNRKKPVLTVPTSPVHQSQHALPGLNQLLLLFASAPAASSSAARLRSSSRHPCPLPTTGVWKFSGLGSMPSFDRPKPHSE